MNQVPATIISEVALRVGHRVDTVLSTSNGHSFPSFVGKLSNKQIVYVKYSLKDAEVFECEAHNLNALIKAKISATRPIVASKKIIVLEYLHLTQPTITLWEDLASQLAYLHSQKQANYGFYEDNYLGQGIQLNKAEANITWADFFWNYRLLPQLKWLPEKLNFILETSIQLKKTIQNELNKDFIYPCLLHGDLWNGNVLFTSDHAYYIDPACYYGHSECDLAMTQLFGGFPLEFYDEYHRHIPPQKGYERRKTIYNFYHLLNHLNIFGSSYLLQAEASLKEIQTF